MLQTVLAAETAHEERPLTIVFLLRHDIRNTMFSNHPHRVQLVFSYTYDTRSEESRVHVEQCLTTCLRVKNATACRRTLPDELTAVFHHTDGSSHRRSLSWRRRDSDIHHLAANRVDKRVEIRMAHYQPAFPDPSCRSHEILRHLRVV